MNNLSDKLKVKPAKEQVTYKVLGVGTVDHLNKRVMHPASVQIPGIDTIFDPFDKEIPNKTIKYITGTYTEIKEGKEVIHEKIGDVVFESNGIITVQPQDFNLYEFMERTNINSSNKYRDKRVSARFERVDKVTEAKEKLEKEDLSLDAQQVAREMPLETLMGYAKEMGINVNRDEAQVRIDMRMKAKENPEAFIRNQTDNKKGLIKLQMTDAQTRGIISYDKEDNKWIIHEDLNKATLCLVDIGGESKLEQLLDFFIEDDKGRDFYNRIVSRLKNPDLELQD